MFEQAGREDDGEVTLREVPGHGVGVPDDMPAEAEKGFDLTIRRIQDLKDDATQQDVAQLGDVSDEDQRKLDALESLMRDTREKRLRRTR